MPWPLQTLTALNIPLITRTYTPTATATLVGPLETLTALAYEDTLTATAATGAAMPSITASATPLPVEENPSNATETGVPVSAANTPDPGDPSGLPGGNPQEPSKEGDNPPPTAAPSLIRTVLLWLCLPVLLIFAGVAIEITNRVKNPE